jgi:hypothetical protein
MSLASSYFFPMAIPNTLFYDSPFDRFFTGWWVMSILNTLPTNFLLLLFASGLALFEGRPVNIMHVLAVLLWECEKVEIRV